MTTKQEYIEALEHMKESYYNLDGCMSAMNKFKEDINLLTELVNEHFKENVETNFEHYKDVILEDYSKNLAVVKGMPTLCYKTNCNNCDFKINQIGCREKAKDWLNQTYKKPTYKLSKFEYDLLNAYKKSGMWKCISNYGTLLEMYGKGHFKGIDTSTTIHEILDNCEVIKND